jgi:hypothetical protein
VLELAQLHDQVVAAAFKLKPKMSLNTACSSCGHPPASHRYDGPLSIPCRRPGCRCADYVWPTKVSVRFRLKPRGRMSRKHGPAAAAALALAVRPVEASVSPDGL